MVKKKRVPQAFRGTFYDRQQKWQLFLNLTDDI
jgi:hypothetical protein